MSGRSFDMTRKAPAAKEAAKPAARKVVRQKAPRQSSPRKTPSLRERRERARNRVGYFIMLVIALITGLIVYGFWRPEVRVQEVRSDSVPDTERASEIVAHTIEGKYFGILPRDSIFFYPEKEVHAAVLAEFPSLESISISRDSFTALSIEGTRRTASFFWCGATPADFSVEVSSCYEADAAGLVFAALTASSTDVHDPSKLRIYAPLTNADMSTYPVRGIVTGAQYLPNLIAFISAIKELGVPVLATFIDGDEAELFVTPETKLMYVLGKENEAVMSAKAALKDLNLMNGTIEYVDLRFPGKLYVKRYSEPE